jgi:predicted permease
VNETFAKYYFENENPIGKRIGFDAAHTDIEIVGVVRDSKYANLREAPVRMVYFPYTQKSLFSAMVIHVRTAGDPAGFIETMRRQVREMDASVAAFNFRTVEQELNRGLSRERLLAVLAALFGGLALVLACIGLYGVTAYAVSRRTREIGIRMALGAQRRGILKLVLMEASALVAAGAIVGLLAAMALTRLVVTMLYGIEPMDVATLAGALAVLACVALIAAWIPARRASRVDPVVALRQ